MQQIIFQDLDASEIWNELIDKECAYNLVQQFNPNYATEWWKTSIRLPNGTELNNISVRGMQFDLLADLPTLEKIISLNVHYLFIYQFKKTVPGTLLIENIPSQLKDKILKQNDFQHSIEIQMDIVTVSGYNENYMSRLRSNKMISPKILRYE